LRREKHLVEARTDGRPGERHTPVVSTPAVNFWSCPAASQT
jgi:hypothetical protein